MATVASYERFSDVAFPLQIGRDIDRTLTRRINTNPVGSEGAVLMYKHWRRGNGSVTYDVTVNGNLITKLTIDSSIPENFVVTVHENLSLNQIRSGDNTVRFQATDGTSAIYISDVLIWYHERV